MKPLSWRVLAPAAALIASAGLTHATAAVNAVGKSHHDTGAVTIAGTDGNRYQVTVDLVESDGPPTSGAVLTVSWRGCKNGSCGIGHQYQLSLAPSQVTITNGNHESVSTTLARVPLQVSWQSNPSGTHVSVKVNGNATNGVIATDPTTGGSAQLNVTIFKVACSGSGTIENDYGATTPPTASGAPAPTKIPAGFKAVGHHKPTCAPG